MSSISRRGVLPNVGYKSPVIVATEAPITLFGPQTIASVVLAPGDRVLVKDQVDTTKNGIYNVQAGDWTRAVDFDDRDDVVNGVQVLNNNNRNVYSASFTAPFIPDTTPITFTTSGAIQAVVWGDITGLIVGQTDLQAELDAKATVANLAITNSNVTALDSALTTHTSDGTIHFTQASITLAQSQVTGLVTDLAAKAFVDDPLFTGTLFITEDIPRGDVLGLGQIYVNATNDLIYRNELGTEFDLTTIPTRTPEEAGHLRLGNTQIIDGSTGYSSFDITANFTPETWQSCGPTESGADVEWIGLDNLPANARAVIVYLSFWVTSDGDNSGGGGRNGSLSIWTTPGDVVTPLTARPKTWQHETSTISSLVIQTEQFVIPLSSGHEFKIRHQKYGDFTNIQWTYGGFITDD